MKSSEYGRITDELLSAYIDNAVTEHERALVEAAVAADDQVAWRLDTLQQTVVMLHALPELALPRSFTLDEARLLEAGPAIEDRSVAPASGASRWERMSAGWRGFWQSGSPVYRNLATASLVLLLVLVSGNALLGPALVDMDDFAAPAAELAAAEVTEPTRVASGQAATDLPDTEAPAAAPPEPDAATGTQPDSSIAPTLASDGSDVQRAPIEQSSALARRAAPEEPQAAAASVQEAPAAAQPPASELPPQRTVVTASQALESFATESQAGELPAPQTAQLAAPGDAALALAAPLDEAGDAEFSVAAADGSAPQPKEQNFTALGDPQLAEEMPAEAPMQSEPAQEEPALDQPVQEESAQDQPPTDALEPEAPSAEATGTPTAGIESTGAQSTDEAPKDDASEETSGEESQGEESQEEESLEEETAIAALPSAQSPARSHSAPATPESLPLTQWIAAGLLIAALLFGGLWWRSRRPA